MRSQTHITPLKGEYRDQLEKQIPPDPIHRTPTHNLEKMLEAYQKGGKAAYLDEWDRLLPKDKLSTQDRADLFKAGPSSKP